MTFPRPSTLRTVLLLAFLTFRPDFQGMTVATPPPEGTPEKTTRLAFLQDEGPYKLSPELYAGLLPALSSCKWISLLEREQIRGVLTEKEFSLKGLCSDAKALGRLLHADLYLFAGKRDAPGGCVRFCILETATGLLLFESSFDEKKLADDPKPILDFLAWARDKAMTPVEERIHLGFVGFRAEVPSGSLDSLAARLGPPLRQILATRQALFILDRDHLPALGEEEILSEKELRLKGSSWLVEIGMKPSENEPGRTDFRLKWTRPGEDRGLFTAVRTQSTDMAQVLWDLGAAIMQKAQELSGEKHASSPKNEAEKYSGMAGQASSFGESLKAMRFSEMAMMLSDTEEYRNRYVGFMLAYFGRHPLDQYDPEEILLAEIRLARLNLKNTHLALSRGEISLPEPYLPIIRRQWDLYKGALWADLLRDAAVQRIDDTRLRLEHYLDVYAANRSGAYCGVAMEEFAKSLDWGKGYMDFVEQGKQADYAKELAGYRARMDQLINAPVIEIKAVDIGAPGSGVDFRSTVRNPEAVARTGISWKKQEQEKAERHKRLSDERRGRFAVRKCRLAIDENDLPIQILPSGNELAVIWARNAESDHPVLIGSLVDVENDRVKELGSFQLRRGLDFDRNPPPWWQYETPRLMGIRDPAGSSPTRDKGNKKKYLRALPFAAAFFEGGAAICLREGLLFLAKGEGNLVTQDLPTDTTCAAALEGKLYLGHSDGLSVYEPGAKTVRTLVSARNLEEKTFLDGGNSYRVTCMLSLPEARMLLFGVSGSRSGLWRYLPWHGSFDPIGLQFSSDRSLENMGGPVQSIRVHGDNIFLGMDYWHNSMLFHKKDLGRLGDAGVKTILGMNSNHMQNHLPWPSLLFLYESGSFSNLDSDESFYLDQYGRITGKTIPMVINNSAYMLHEDLVQMAGTPRRFHAIDSTGGIGLYTYGGNIPVCRPTAPPPPREPMMEPWRMPRSQAERPERQFKTSEPDRIKLREEADRLFPE